ncbi:unnamed protein product [Orchesella dallaii]|uniref:Uncharacterized protein n=1 Tax=Orchesella dallaii TaxID=48710 RepID=A0ABP1RZD7_9HEXA
MERKHLNKLSTSTIFVLGFLLSHSKATPNPGPIPSLFDISVPDNTFQVGNSDGNDGINFDAALSKSISLEKNKGIVAPPVIEFKTTTRPIVNPSPVPLPPYVAPPPVRRPCKRDAENAAFQPNSTNPATQHVATATTEANSSDPNAQQVQHQQHVRDLGNATGQQAHNVTEGIIIIQDVDSKLHHPHVRSDGNSTQVNTTLPQESHQQHVRSVADQRLVFSTPNTQQNATNATNVHFQHIRNTNSSTVGTAAQADDKDDDDQSDRKKRAVPSMMGNMGLQQTGNTMGNMQQQTMMSMGHQGSDVIMNSQHSRAAPMMSGQGMMGMGSQSMPMMSVGSQDSGMMDSNPHFTRDAPMPMMNQPQMPMGSQDSGMMDSNPHFTRDVPMSMMNQPQMPMGSQDSGMMDSNPHNTRAAPMPMMMNQQQPGMAMSMNQPSLMNSAGQSGGMSNNPSSHMSNDRPISPRFSRMVERMMNYFNPDNNI